MSFSDLREYVSELEKEGELMRIKTAVDWDQEVGAIIRRSYDLKAPAPFFEKIKGYPKGYRIFGAPVGTSSAPNRLHCRLAISMGLRPSSTREEIIERYIEGKNSLLKPILVKDGPCKENILSGDDVDLYKFPAPFIHSGDGGRYIGTWHVVITKDPDTNWVNWGMYRLMVHDRNTMGGIVVPQQHNGLMYFEKYESRNAPMEFAIAIGTEPVTPLIGAAMLPEGVNEVDVVGGIRGCALEVIKCETVDLEVPAHSEIVIEGVMLPHERKDEGPFGEWHGYRAGLKSPRPVYHVKAITHRNDPILPVSCMGVPVDDCAAVMPLFMSGDILDHLRNQGFPVRMVYSPLYTASHMVAVSTKVPYHNFAKKIAHSIWGTKAGGFMYYVIVVDDDVDVTNMEEVLWALTTRCHPHRGIYVVPDAPAAGTPLPFLAPQDRLSSRGLAYALFDCTWPKDWPKEAIPEKASFDVLWSREIQEKVLKNWEGYGYTEK